MYLKWADQGLNVKRNKENHTNLHNLYGFDFYNNENHTNVRQTQKSINLPFHFHGRAESH